MNTSLSRRDLILAGVGAAIAAVGAGGFSSALFAQASVSVEQFLVLSQKLTETKNLDADVAKKLLGGQERFRRLAAAFFSNSATDNCGSGSWLMAAGKTGTSESS